MIIKFNLKRHDGGPYNEFVAAFDTSEISSVFKGPNFIEVHEKGGNHFNIEGGDTNNNLENIFYHILSRMEARQYDSI